MNFSSTSHDAETHNDPWASSPQAHTTSFPSGALDPQSSPAPSPYGSALGPGHAPEHAEADLEDSYAADAPDDDAEPSSPEEAPEDLSQKLQGPGIGEETSPISQARTEQRRPVARPVASRPVPQYKLVAKITGLERTGRKDPILRFDVYVRS
jgi:hypothetical protein